MAHRRDNDELARSDAHEVDQWHLLDERSAKGAVVRLVDRAGPVVVEDRATADDDVELLVRCAAATISPPHETGLDVEEEALLLSLEHADWLGAIVSVARAGPGADTSPDGLVEGIRSCPEVELESELDLDDESHLETAFWILALPWQMLRLTDPDQRLTAPGTWILPRALAQACGGELDREPQPNPEIDRGQREPEQPDPR